MTSGSFSVVSTNDQRTSGHKVLSSMEQHPWLNAFCSLFRLYTKENDEKCAKEDVGLLSVFDQRGHVCLLF